MIGGRRSVAGVDVGEREGCRNGVGGHDRRG